MPESAKLAGEGAPRELCDVMHAAWVRFAATGDPGWQAWDARHPVRIFDDGFPYTAYGPRDAEIALWSAAPTVPEPAPASDFRAPGAELASAVRRLRRSVGARRH